jgi:hypothetical protein
MLVLAYRRKSQQKNRPVNVPVNLKNVWPFSQSINTTENFLAAVSLNMYKCQGAFVCYRGKIYSLLSLKAYRKSWTKGNVI